MNNHLPIKSPNPNLLAPVRYVESSEPAQEVWPSRNRRLWAFLKRYWWIPVLVTGAALASAAAFITLSPPTYVSRAKLWETEKMRLPESGDFVQDIQNYFGTQMELLKSDSLKLLALQRLKGTNALVAADSTTNATAIHIQASQLPKTAVIEVEAFCTDPKYARQYLDALLAAYLDYKNNIHQEVSGDTLTSISEQALRLETELRASQEALTAFERTNNLAILEEEGRVEGGHLTRLQEQYSDLQLQQKLLEASALERQWVDIDSTNAPGVPLGGFSSGAGTAPPSFLADRQQALRDLEVLKVQRAQLSRYLRPKHPRIVKLDADIDRAQKLLGLYRRQSEQELQTMRQALQMRCASVAASIKEWEVKVVQANNRIAEADRLKLSVNRTQALYDRLMLVLQNVDVSRSVDHESLRVLEPASPAERYYLRDALVLAAALAMGLLAGIGLVLLVEWRDDRFSSVLEVDEKFGDSVVGQVPEFRPIGNGEPLALLENSNESDMFSEAYRNLRSALLFLPYEGQRPQVVLITSAVPDEGKSTVAANLAKALAAGGSRVLLVDGDMRKGELHKMLGLKGAPGFAELLAAPANANQFIQTDSVPNLEFLARGTSPLNPGDLLLKPHLEQLLAAWRGRYDYILIDSSPVFSADDAASLAHKVDGTLFIVRRRFSSEKAVREAVELLLRRQARVLGFVFNRADASASSYYYYKYPEYHAAAKAG